MKRVVAVLRYVAEEVDVWIPRLRRMRRDSSEGLLVDGSKKSYVLIQESGL